MKEKILIHQSTACFVYDFDYKTMCFRKKKDFCNLAVKFASERDGFETGDTKAGTHNHDEISYAIEVTFAGKKGNPVVMTEQVNNAISYTEGVIEEFGEAELYCEEPLEPDGIDIAGTPDLLLLYDNFFIIADWKTGAAGESNPYIKDIQGIWYIALAFETMSEFNKGIFQFVPTGVENMDELLQDKEKFYAMEITREQYHELREQLLSVVDDVQNIINDAAPNISEMCEKCRYFHQCKPTLNHNYMEIKNIPVEVSEEAIIENLGELYSKVLVIEPVIDIIKTKAKEQAKNGGLKLNESVTFRKIEGKTQTVKDYPLMAHELLKATTCNNGKPNFNELYKCLDKEKCKRRMDKIGASFSDEVFGERKYSPTVLVDNEGKIIDKDNALKLLT